MSFTNHQFRLAGRPVGLPTRADWNYTEEPVGEPAEGEVLVKVLYLSLDPRRAAGSAKADRTSSRLKLAP